MLDLKQLAVFVRVAESGSLTKAAIVLDLARSGVSRQLQDLELEIGHKLFHRTGRGMLLSDNGKKLLPRAKRLLSDAQQLEDEARSTIGTPTGTVVIGLPASVAELLAGPLLERVRARYAQVRIRLVEGLSGQIEELLADGRADIGLFFAKKPNSRRGDVPLCANDLYLIGPPGDRLTSQKSVKLSTMSGLPIILPGLPHALRALVEDAFASGGIKLRVPLEVDSMSTMKAVAASGGGYTISSFDMVSHDVSTGRLQAARIVAPALERLLVMCATFHKPLSVPTRLLMAEITTLVTELVTSGGWKARLPQANGARAIKSR
jgi:DNA-binding transcriptional LysR family regulator